MFGPAFLVAPVTEQGATSRAVYLPAGADWYNYWTNERLPRRSDHPRAAAPIDTLPLFVRAGSILPLGEAIESTNQVQTIAKVRVYPGADADFTLYQDDGKTYAYEKGDSSITHLHWDEASQKAKPRGSSGVAEFGCANSRDRRTLRQREPLARMASSSANSTHSTRTMHPKGVAILWSTCNTP